MYRWIPFTLLFAACGDHANVPIDAAALDAPSFDAFTIDAGPRCMPSSGLPTPLSCNGHPELCDRTYDAVAFPMTHNAMSNEEEQWTSPNQGRTLWHQLEDGVRGFMLDTWLDGFDRVMLCHAVCAPGAGQRPLIDALHDLREFMDCHPAEVITIVFEAHVTEAETAAVFEEAGLSDYLDRQPADAPWPTLRMMIEAGRRLVIFTESAETSLPWYHYAYAYTWDNPYAAQMPSDLSCALGRGSQDHPLFLINHFLTNPLASRPLAAMVNHDPVLAEHIDRCRTETGDFPNFVALDFYDDSDLFPLIERLNGF